MLAAGNAVVFNVHPSARQTSIRNIHLINEAILAAGGPRNVVTTIAEPTIQSAQALMQHKGIRILVVTGGPGVVKAALASGKRAICAGPGNPPVVVDETALVEKAGRDLARGHSSDNNVICTDAKAVFVVASVPERLKKSIAAGGYELKSWQQERLMKTIFKETRGAGRPGVINTAFIGKNAGVILEAMGVSGGANARLLFLEVEAEHPLVWTEQMMPVLPIVRVKDADEGIDLARKAEHGFGHTASMHSLNLANLSRMAREINTSIFVKNGPNLAGLGFGGEGHTSFTIASPTGEGLTNPVSFSRLRRCTLVDHFRIV